MLALFLIITTALAEWQSESRLIRWKGGEVVVHHPRFGGLAYDGPRPKTRGGNELSQSVPDVGPATLVPQVTSEEALRIVARQWRVTPTNRGTLVVFPVEGKAILAWRFSLSALGGRHLVYVDAINGQIVSAKQDFWSVDGWVYDESPLDGDLTLVELPVDEHAVRLNGRFVWASHCVDWTIDPRPFGVRTCHAWRQLAKADPQGDFFVRPDEGLLDDPFAEVNAFYHADQFAEWFAFHFGLRTPQMQIFTGFPMTNAFFGDFDGDGKRDLSFGVTDDGLNFAHDSDVVIHEYGHAIVRELAGGLSMDADHLGVDWTAGALNEGIADTFSMLINPDGLLGESMARSHRWDKAIRDLRPDRFCPDDLASQVHASGQIWGSMSWNLIEDPRVGPEVVRELMVGALVTWDEEIDWPRAGQSVLDAADQLLESDWISVETRDAVFGHVEATGILDCERIVDLSQVEASKISLLNLGLFADYERIPAGIQFKYPLPAGKDEIKIRVSDFSGPEKGTGLAVYLRVGDPVLHAPAQVEGLGLAHAIPVQYDAVFEIDEAEEELVINANNLSTFRAGSVVHWSVASINRTRTPMDAAYLSATIKAEATNRRSAEDRGSKSSCNMVPLHRSIGSIWVLVFGGFVVRVRRQ